MGRGPTLRLDCRYMNMTNNPLRYEFKLKRRKDPEIILSTINVNHFNDKYHNRASEHVERGLVQLFIQRYNTSDLGQYTCTLNIPEDLTINQTVSINVSKGKIKVAAKSAQFLCFPVYTVCHKENQYLMCV